MQANKNIIVLQQMVKLSSIVRDIKEARLHMGSASFNTRLFVVNGEPSNMITTMLTRGEKDCMYLELLLRSKIQAACKYLKGFDETIMDPIDYISTHDIKNEAIDLCKNNKVVATIYMDTGKIVLSKNNQQTAE